MVFLVLKGQWCNTNFKLNGSLSIIGVRNKYPKSAARVFTLAAFLGGAVKDPVSEAIKIAHAEAYPF